VKHLPTISGNLILIHDQMTKKLVKQQKSSDVSSWTTHRINKPITIMAKAELKQSQADRKPAAA